MFAICLGTAGATPGGTREFLDLLKHREFSTIRGMGLRQFNHGSFTLERGEPGSGKPGKTTYSLTGPGGAHTSMIAPGYSEDAAVGDLDNDGQSGDAALVMGMDNHVTVIRLVGGTLQSPVAYPTGWNPLAVAVGDVNGDQFTDLVTANASPPIGSIVPGSLSVLLGNAAGTFDAASTFPASGSPGDVSLGDFNGDGKLDVALADLSPPNGSATTHGLIVRLGMGDGDFGPEIPVATAQPVWALQVVDFNGDVDGHDDIVTSGSVLLGRGDGTFAAPINVAPGLDPYLVQVEDINQDHKPDLILVWGGRSFLATIVLGRGDGTVDAPQHYVLNTAASAVAYYDVEGDGISDLLFSGGSDATLLTGRGDGTFHGVPAIPTVPNLSGQTGTATGAAVADFTGDGIPDVAVANDGSTRDGALIGNAAAILPGFGGGKLGSPLAIPGLPGSRIVTGDWNGDAKPDLALVGAVFSSGGAGGNSFALNIAPGLGGGVFGPHTSTALPGPTTPYQLIPSLVTASLNHDSIPDLLVGTVTGAGVSVFLGNGSGGFTAQTPVIVGNSSPIHPAIGDFNEDTHPDLVIAYQDVFGRLNGGMEIALGNGNGTFQAPQILRSAVSGKGVAAADFNRDGHLDLALALEYASYRWDVEIHLGGGNGSFAAPMPLRLKETRLGGVVVLDADQDGKPDLVLPRPYGSGALGLRGLGNGIFKPVATAPIGGDGAALAADLNQDGWPDLLAPSGFLGLYINELPVRGLKYPLLEIGLAAGKVTLKWPDFYPDYTLTETPDPGTPFTPSARAVTLLGGSFNVDVNPAEAKAGYFRLEPK